MNIDWALGELPATMFRIILGKGGLMRKLLTSARSITVAKGTTKE